MPPALQLVLINHTPLAKVPSQLGSYLPTLIKLDLSHNRIQSLEGVFFCKNLPALKVFSIAHNHITHVNLLSDLLGHQTMLRVCIAFNPFSQCEYRKVRHMFVNSMKGLMVVDRQFISSGQRGVFMMHSVSKPNQPYEYPQPQQPSTQHSLIDHTNCQIAYIHITFRNNYFNRAITRIFRRFIYTRIRLRRKRRPKNNALPIRLSLHLINYLKQILFKVKSFSSRQRALKLLSLKPSKYRQQFLGVAKKLRGLGAFFGPLGLVSTTQARNTIYLTVASCQVAFDLFGKTGLSNFILFQEQDKVVLRERKRSCYEGFTLQSALHCPITILKKSSTKADLLCRLKVHRHYRRRVLKNAVLSDKLRRPIYKGMMAMNFGNSQAFRQGLMTLMLLKLKSPETLFYTTYSYMEREIAALRIQSYFRMTRQSDRKKALKDAIHKQRAARIIQNCWRSSIAFHRQNCFWRIKNQLKNVPSVLYLPFNSYFALQQLDKMQRRKLPEQLLPCQAGQGRAFIDRKRVRWLCGAQNSTSYQVIESLYHLISRAQHRLVRVKATTFLQLRMSSQMARCFIVLLAITTYNCKQSRFLRVIRESELQVRPSTQLNNFPEDERVFLLNERRPQLQFSRQCVELGLRMYSQRKGKDQLFYLYISLHNLSFSQCKFKTINPRRKALPAPLVPIDIGDVQALDQLPIRLAPKLRQKRRRRDAEMASKSPSQASQFETEQSLKPQLSSVKLKMTIDCEIRQAKVKWLADIRQKAQEQCRRIKACSHIHNDQDKHQNRRNKEEEKTRNKEQREILQFQRRFVTLACRRKQIRSLLS